MTNRPMRIIITGGLCGLSAGFLILSFIWIECTGAWVNCYKSGNELLFPAALGGFIAGLCLYGLWGREGVKGAWVAVLAAILVTVLGAMVAVVVLGVTQGDQNILSDPWFVLLGPYLIIIMFDQFPILIPIWAASMAAIHLIIRRMFQSHTQV